MKIQVFRHSLEISSNICNLFSSTINVYNLLGRDFRPFSWEYINPSGNLPSPLLSLKSQQNGSVSLYRDRKSGLGERLSALLWQFIGYYKVYIYALPPLPSPMYIQTLEALSAHLHFCPGQEESPSTFDKTLNYSHCAKVPPLTLSPSS